MKGGNLVKRSNIIKLSKSEDGFTLIESLAAWTILLIAVTIFLRCLGIAHFSMGKGTVMRKQYMTALESVELGEKPLRTKERKLKFNMNNTTISMDAVVMEYGMSWAGEGEKPPLTLKVIGPVPESGK